MKKRIISFLMLGVFFAGGLLYAGCADSPSGPEPLKVNDITYPSKGPAPKPCDICPPHTVCKTTATGEIICTIPNWRHAFDGF